MHICYFNVLPVKVLQIDLKLQCFSPTAILAPCIRITSEVMQLFLEVAKR